MHILIHDEWPKMFVLCVRFPRVDEHLRVAFVRLLSKNLEGKVPDWVTLLSLAEQFPEMRIERTLRSIQNNIHDCIREFKVKPILRDGNTLEGNDVIIEFNISK